MPLHNIKKHDGKTVEQCAALCLDNSKCLAFEYYVDYGGTRQRPDGYCAEQNSVNKDGCDGMDENCDLYVKRG